MRLVVYFISLSLFLYTDILYATDNQPVSQIPIKEYPNYLLFGVPNKFGPFNPTASTAAQTKLALPLVYEQLVAVNAQQQLEPILAKSWDIDFATKTITIHLNHHFFSDGTEVTAYDVVDSLNRLCAPSSLAAGELNGLIGCQFSKNGNSRPAVKAIDKYTVELKTINHPTIFLYQLTASRAVITKQTKLELLGSGPYKVSQITPYYLALSINSFYHNKEAIKNPGLIIAYLDENNISNLIKNYHPDGSIMYRYSAISNIQFEDYSIIQDKPYITEMLVLNNQKFPFNNQIVRKAILSALYNQDKIYKCVNGVSKAYGIIPTGLGGAMTSTAPNYMPSISPDEVFQVVPELKEKHTQVVIYQHLGRKNLCEAQQLIEAARPYHIDISFKYEDDYATLWPLYLSKKLHGFVELYIFKNREAYSVMQFFIPSSQENFVNTTDKNLDSLLEKAMSAATSHHRFQAYRDLNFYMLDNAVTIPFYYVGSSNLISKCLGGVSQDFYFNPYQYLPGTYRIKGCKI